jgi:hypothetical protein
VDAAGIVLVDGGLAGDNSRRIIPHSDSRYAHVP